MSTQPHSERHLALLIDGDNISHKKSEQIINAVSNDWIVASCHIYGNSNNLPPWQKAMKKIIKEKVIETYPAEGKNAADFRLTIRVMDILFSKSVDGFCIVSSDADFVTICSEIRSKKLPVIVIGEKKTPPALIEACNKFIRIEDIPNTQPQIPLLLNTATKKPKHAKTLLLKAFNESTKEDGWVNLSALEQTLQQIDSNFDSGTYGCKSLPELIKHLTHQFTFKEDKEAGNYVSLIDA